MRTSGKGRTKLNVEKAHEIRRESRENPNATPDSLGKKYGVSITTIKAIIKGRLWKEQESGDSTRYERTSSTA